ncbi:MAG TPA: class I SAM-dependent methyltransferase [Ktedonobacterales bacterium]|nr:class I SAM-dependent methyltransferase [Ktedonobacterales bacterium]
MSRISHRRISIAQANDDFERYLAAADEPFAGWDFSWLTRTERMASEPLPWSYASEVLPYLWRARWMADLGTGGGEFLACLSPLPPTTYATEGYPPNVAVARARLEALGVQVYETDETEALPFADGALDLIIDRHESYRPEEVYRALRLGGHFITQQVGGANEKAINDWLGIPFDVPWATWSLETAAQGLESAGFAILTRREATAPTRFYDIGAVVYYLKAIPWQIPDFSVERYRDALLRLHERIQADGYLEMQSARFLIVARKPE